MNWSKSSHGSSRVAAPVAAKSKSTATSHGSSSIAQSSHGSAKCAATSYGSVIVATSSYGSVELVELPGTVGTSYIVIIGGIVAGVALLVPGGILLYGAVYGAAAATGGIMAAAAALAASYPVATVIVAGASIGAGFQALMYSLPGGDDWEELGKQILKGALIGGLTSACAVGAAAGVSAGITISARTVQGTFSFGLTEVTLQALIDSAIVAAATGAGNAVATHLTRWVIDGEGDIAELFIDLGLNMIMSVAPIAGGGIALRFCTTKAAVMLAASVAGVGASLLDPPETAGMAILRLAMAGAQGALLGIHLHKISNLFHVSADTTVQYLPAEPDKQNHGFNIYEDVAYGNRDGLVHGHVRANHGLRTVVGDHGGEVHVKMPNGKYLPAPMALRQANAMQANEEFVAAANAIRDAIVVDPNEFAGRQGLFHDRNRPLKPLLQKDKIVHPHAQLRSQLEAVQRACAKGAAKVMCEELKQVLPVIGLNKPQRGHNAATAKESEPGYWCNIM